MPREADGMAKRTVVALTLELLRRVARLVLKGRSLAEVERVAGHPMQAVTGSEEIVRIYVADCQGLADMSRRLAARSGASGCRVSKIGVTETTLDRRLASLGRERYGALQCEQNGQMVERSGFDLWIARPIHVSRQSFDPAISVAVQSINVALPSGMTRRRLDAGLAKALAPYALVRHKHPECYTYYGEHDRLSRATELVVGFDPRRDGDVLLSTVEGVLEHHRQHQSGQLPVAGQRGRVQSASANEKNSIQGTRRMSEAQRRAMWARKRRLGRCW